jgi:hypothetical protein
MAYNSAISSSDPHAVEKLTEKMEGLKKRQEHMKDVNAYYRKHKTCKGFPEMSDAVAVKFDANIQNAHSWEKQPFPTWRLSNNNAEIKRCEKRIAEITRNRDVGFSGWEFEGGHAVADSADNRLRLFFDEKPNEQTRTQLKIRGFKWAPTQGAWQRQLTANAIYAAERLECLAPVDGRTIHEIQPRPPAKDTGAR